MKSTWQIENGISNHSSGGATGSANPATAAAPSAAASHLTDSEIDRLRDLFLSKNGIIHFDDLKNAGFNRILDLMQLGWLQKNTVRHEGGYLAGMRLINALLARNSVITQLVIRG